MLNVGFEPVVRRLAEFFDFCKEFGLDAEAERGRFGAYRKTLLSLKADVERTGNTVVRIDRDKLPNLFVALAESREVGVMLPFLRSCEPTVVSPRLHAILKGPELRGAEDDASNQARNIQFELWLANELWRVGVDVALAEPDLKLRRTGRLIFVACKRLLSVNKLTRRINEATGQLRRNLSKTTEPAWGIIALSLSTVLTAPDHAESVENRTAGMSLLAARIDNLVLRRAKWRQSREAHGIVCHVSSLFTNVATERLEVGNFLTLFGDGPVCEDIAAMLGRVTASFNAPPDSNRPAEEDC